MMDSEVMQKLLDRARGEYRDSDAAGDVLDWLDAEVAALAAPSAGAEAVALRLAAAPAGCVDLDVIDNALESMEMSGMHKEPAYRALKDAHALAAAPAVSDPVAGVMDDAIVDDLIHAGRVMERYEHRDYRPLSKSNFHIYDSARKTEWTYRRKLTEATANACATGRLTTDAVCAMEAMVAAAEQRAEAMAGLLERLLDHVDGDTCLHETTHRGGAIWTICDGCGQQWADDEGGFKPHVDAPVVAEARALLTGQATPEGS